jgi:hypothetical protein
LALRNIFLREDRHATNREEKQWKIIPNTSLKRQGKAETRHGHWGNDSVGLRSLEREEQGKLGYTVTSRAAMSDKE